MRDLLIVDQIIGAMHKAMMRAWWYRFYGRELDDKPYGPDKAQFAEYAMAAWGPPSS